MAMRSNTNIDPIVTKYVRGEVLNVKETIKLTTWLGEGDGRAELLERLKIDPEWTKENLINMRDLPHSKIWERIGKRLFYELKWGDEEKELDIAPTQIVTDTKVINRALLDVVKNDLEHIHKMTPREFEFLVAEMLEKKGYQVEITPETRDWGKDLIAVKHIDFGKFIFFVECKRNELVRPVGIEVVQRLYGAVTGNATAGLIVTSSDFSTPAKTFTKKIEHQMSLVNYYKLCEWIRE
jgi:HJR/Mrr/RecB family endonuclease